MLGFNAAPCDALPAFSARKQICAARFALSAYTSGVFNL